MKTLTFGSLFTGIGGLDLGFERAGMRCLWQSEVNPYCIEILKKNWPSVLQLGDIGTLRFPPYVDLICGGFPCQPYSQAGRREGEKDKRNLWPSMFRVIREVKPRWVVGENVPGLLNFAYFKKICCDLEGEGYEVLPLEFPAAAVGAPHIRYRLFIMAHTYSTGREEQRGAFSVSAAHFASERGSDVIPYPNCNNKQRGSSAVQVGGTRSTSKIEKNGYAYGTQWEIEPSVGRVADGIPHRVDRLKALGNAVVPQVAEWIGRIIVNCEE